MLFRSILVGRENSVRFLCIAERAFLVASALSLRFNTSLNNLSASRLEAEINHVYYQEYS